MSAAKSSGFTVVQNEILRDKSLSYRAKGLFVDLLSLPPDWVFSIAGLISRSTDGRASVAAALKELEEHGYIQRKQSREGGKFSSSEYVVHQSPLTDLPLSEKPMTEKPTAGNQQLVNTKVLSTKVPNTIDTNIPLSPKPKQRKINDVLAELEDEALREALNEFVTMRRKMKKPLTVHALELNIKELYRMSTDISERTKIVEQSVMFGWQGFYPLKRNSGGAVQSQNTNNEHNTNNIFLQIAQERGIL